MRGFAQITLAILPLVASTPGAILNGDLYPFPQYRKSA
jgi:hypothetical protein